MKVSMKLLNEINKIICSELLDMPFGTLTIEFKTSHGKIHTISSETSKTIKPEDLILENENEQ